MMSINRDTPEGFAAVEVRDFTGGDSTRADLPRGVVDAAREDVARQVIEREMEERLGRMPREIGALLLTIGVVGVVLPGIVGTPALLAGGLVLWPRGFRGINGWLRRRCPKIHAKGMEQLLRYLDDMERRYPSRSSQKSPAAPEEPQP